MKKEIDKATACVHAGTYRDPLVPGLNSPVFTSSAFDYRGEGATAYPRYFNTPNQDAVVDKLKVLEQGEAAMVFSSGMAAISTALMSILKPGDHIILQKGIYGGTHYFIETQLKKWKVDCSYVLSTDLDSLGSTLRENTKVIYVETPSNPLLEIVDLELVAGFAKKNNLISLIDNTFASPINQNPISYGFDFVLHSGTKYLSGHSDVTFGAVVTSRQFYEGMHTCAINFGGSLDANTCYLIERSLKTLSLRVSRQNETALAIAQLLNAHPQIQQVNYPGLPSHPNHDVARRQMSGFGGMLSFELDRSDQEVVEFLDKLQLISCAVSLGGVESTICSPMRTSHVKMSPQDRKAAGISDGLLRLSVGIEDSKDLIDDLENALSVLSVVIS
ncbi:MAG: trans-sulfuration enzyme family protein [Cyclobacteriaceae bacterium]